MGQFRLWGGSALRGLLLNSSALVQLWLSFGCNEVTWYTTVVVQLWFIIVWHCYAKVQIWFSLVWPDFIWFSSGSVWVPLLVIAFVGV